MYVQLNKCEDMELLQKQMDKPHEWLVHFQLQSILDGKIKMEVIVNKWPHPSVVIFKPIKEEVMWARYMVHICYASDLQEFRNMLLDPSVINYSKSIAIAAVDDSRYRLLQEVAQIKNFQAVPWADTVIAYQKGDTQTKDKECLPSGFVVSNLELCEADIIVSCWKFSEEGAKAYMQFLISQYPSTCIRRADTAEPVGWCLMNHFGLIINLFVKPECRNRGLGTIIVREQTQRVHLHKYHAVAFIESDNYASQELFRKCGYTIGPKQFSVKCLAN